MDELKRDLAAVNTRLASMESHSAQMIKQVGLMREDIQGLLGTFASIEKHLVSLFEWKATVEQRLTALERRQPPAA